jgi:peptide/nickel transport system substrate-binding protein
MLRWRPRLHAICGLALVVVLAAAGCGPAPAAKPEAKPAETKTVAGGKGGNLIMGLGSEPLTLDSCTTSTVPSFVVSMNVFDQLVWLNTDKTLKPGLAESWETSADGKAITFKLRKSVKFHDGTAFDADAVKFTFDRIMDPATKAVNKGSMGPLQKVEVVDPNTVRFVFTDYYAPFLFYLANYDACIVSPAAVKKYGADFGRHPVGTGPFIFKEWVAKDRIVLTKNPDYNWAPPMYTHQGPAYLETITFRFITEDVPRMGTLETGECNAVVYLSADGLARFKAAPDKYVVIQALVPGASHAFFLNVKKFPTDDLAVRQAMNWAVDIDKMISTLYKGVETPAHGLLSPADPAYDKELDKTFGYDPKKAEQILQSGGWRKGSNGIYSKGGKELSLIMTSLDAQRYLMYAEFVQAALQSIGMKVSMQVVAGPARMEAGQKGTSNMVPVGEQGVGDPDILRYLYHSSNIGKGLNFSQLSDAKMDRALEDATKIRDLNQRLAAYKDIQKQLLAVAPILPVRHITHNFANRAEVKGIRMCGKGYYPLLYDCYVEPKAK